MFDRIRADVEFAGPLVLTIALVPFVAGCSYHAPLAVGTAVGGTLLGMHLSGSSHDSGDLAVYLSDGRMLEGMWSRVGDRDVAEGVAVITPRGLLTAADLVDPEVPAVTGTVTHLNTRMICAFVGDRHSGYRAYCADNTGMWWLGDRRPGVQWASKWSLAVYSDKNPNLLTSFNGRVAVAVQPARD